MPQRTMDTTQATWLAKQLLSWIPEAGASSRPALPHLPRLLELDINWKALHKESTTPALATLAPKTQSSAPELQSEGPP